MKKYNTIIIGAGASGLMTGSFLKNTLILEKNNIPGKKLLLTGSGKCNFTNIINDNDFLKNINTNSNFFKKCYYNFNNIKLINFFNKNGLQHFVREDGKVFPKSVSAKDILSLLLKQNKDNSILYNQKIKNIIFKNREFNIITTDNSFYSKKLVIATGGKSYPRTGSTGDGYHYAKLFGHTIIEPKPALAPLFPDNYPFADLTGNSYDVIITLLRNNKKYKTFQGELLLTHKGFSGPIIINNSVFVNKNDKIQINFTKLKYEELINLLKKERNQSINKLLYQIKLTNRFINLICNKLEINKSTKIHNISTQNIKLIISQYLIPSFTINKIGGFNNAMITSGGISTKELDNNSLKSKLNQNLYFCGEIINIDGITGGYNLQIAFSTGYAVAYSINKTIEKGGDE